MDEKTAERISKFRAKREEDFGMWNFQFEVLCEGKDIYDVIYSDAIGDAEIASLSDEIKKSCEKKKDVSGSSTGSTRSPNCRV